MLNFQFHAPTKILFGRAQVENLPAEISRYGKNILIVTGKGSIKRNGIFSDIEKVLNNASLSYTELSGVDPNPRISTVREGGRICREKGIDFILAIGGGSVIDCAKAISFAACYEGDPWDFWIGKTTVEKTLPVGTVLTLSATGSEMNWGSVISNTETEEKRGKGNVHFIPQFSILDPEYTYSVSPYQTAAGVVDIMTHVFEYYFSPEKGAFLQDSLAEAVLKTCIKYGPVALREPENYEARANLMWASSMGLNGVIGRGKRFEGVLHGIEHAISALYDLTHGTGLAILTKPWFDYVLDESTLWRFVSYARNVWEIRDDDDLSAAQKGIIRTKQFYRELKIPLTLTEAGIESFRMEDILDRTISENETRGNFKALNREDIKKILSTCL